MLCAYSEVLGFRGQSGALRQLHEPSAPAGSQGRRLAAGLPAIDFGALVSMFACVLACATAAAEFLMRMAHEGGSLPLSDARVLKHGTPGALLVLSTAK